MGQQDIIDILKKNKGTKYTSKQLSEITGTSMGSVTTACKKLTTYGFIKYRSVRRGNHHGHEYWIGRKENEKTNVIIKR